MASARALNGLMKWLRREEWQEPFEEFSLKHLGPACEEAGLSPGELPGTIGEAYVGTLWGCIFEDFMTCEFDDGNIVDDYLERRG